MHYYDSVYIIHFPGLRNFVSLVSSMHRPPSQQQLVKNIPLQPAGCISVVEYRSIEMGPTNTYKLTNVIIQ